ncbi:uncharacterized protein LOC131848647 [Achroia grisella]|uniref:uncharacterized protein LOC131848647 n=1 Tax=Achroia grisella TaxID=688607 RepID=UPI0027D25FE3|nr:uncharacterized protein LOC131848647 [Achroia grisella]
MDSGNRITTVEMSNPHLILHTLVVLHFCLNVLSQFPPAPFPYPGPQGTDIGGPMPPMGPMGPVSMGQMGPVPMMPIPPSIPAMPHRKLPVVVMPYYSKLADKKRHMKVHRKRRLGRKRLEYDSSSEDSDSNDSSNDFDFRTTKRGAMHRGKKRQVLTPVVSYVTKDGYVVYQKKIKKEKAKDWLEIGKKNNRFHDSIEKEDDSEGIQLSDLKNKIRFSKKSRTAR